MIAADLTMYTPPSHGLLIAVAAVLPFVVMLLVTWAACRLDCPADTEIEEVPAG